MDFFNMNVYFDKDSFLSLLDSYGTNKYDDCIRMLSNHCNWYFCFPKKDQNDWDESDETLFEKLSQFSDGFNVADIVWNADFPLADIKPSDVRNLRGELTSSVYLFKSFPYKKDLLEQGQLLISEFESEIDTLSNLWFEDLQYTLNIFDTINQWSDLSKYKSPCTDIVISDPYIANDEMYLECNLYSIIRTLCSGITNGKINIVIFSNGEERHRDSSTGRTISSQINWSQIKDKIKRIVKSIHKYNVVDITIVPFTADVKEHDRTIYTNYKLFASHDSYVYFSSDANNNIRKITNGRYFEVYSLVSKYNAITAEKFLQDMQKNYDHIVSVNSSRIIRSSSDAKSGVLNL